MVWWQHKIFFFLNDWLVSDGSWWVLVVAVTFNCDCWTEKEFLKCIMKANLACWQWTENPDEKISERKSSFLSGTSCSPSEFWQNDFRSAVRVIQVKFHWGFCLIISHFLNKILRIHLHSPDTVTISPRMHTKQVTSAECLLCLVSVYSANVSLHYILEALFLILKKVLKGTLLQIRGSWFKIFKTDFFLIQLNTDTLQIPAFNYKHILTFRIYTCNSV